MTCGDAIPGACPVGDTVLSLGKTPQDATPPVDGSADGDSKPVPHCHGDMVALQTLSGA